MTLTQSLSRLSAVVSVILLASCSSISKDECLRGDWYSLGVNDGKAGTVTGKFRDYQKDCAEHGVTPDFKAYQQGHSQGLVFYCDFAHGEAHGRNGAEYNTACNGKLEADFRRGYQQGRRWYQAKSKVDELATAISSIQRRIDQNKDEIYHNNQQIAMENDPNRRAALLYRTDRLRDELEQYHTELGRLQVQFYQAQQAFAPLNRR